MLHRKLQLNFVNLLNNHF